MSDYWLWVLMSSNIIFAAPVLIIMWVVFVFFDCFDYFDDGSDMGEQ